MGGGGDGGGWLVGDSENKVNSAKLKMRLEIIPRILDPSNPTFINSESKAKKCYTPSLEKLFQVCFSSESSCKAARGRRSGQTRCCRGRSPAARKTILDAVVFSF